MGAQDRESEALEHNSHEMSERELPTTNRQSGRQENFLASRRAHGNQAMKMASARAPSTRSSPAYSAPAL